MIRPAIITCSTELDILGRTITRDMLLYSDNCSKVSTQPFLISFSLPKKYPSLEILQKVREFVVHIMDDEFLNNYKNKIENLTIYEDPYKTIPIKTIDSVKIDCPRLPKAEAYFECEKVKEMEAGDSIIFIGRVIYRE